MGIAREQPPVERIVRPFQDFAHKQSSGGILLIATTVVALVWANSPWGESYAALWHTKVTIGGVTICGVFEASSKEVVLAPTLSPGTFYSRF